MEGMGYWQDARTNSEKAILSTLSNVFPNIDDRELILKMSTSAKRKLLEILKDAGYHVPKQLLNS